MFKSVDEVIKYIIEIIPYYVPEWKFDLENKDIGGIFAFAFARMMEINYKQFEKILNKHYISFLNCLSIPLLSGRPKPATGFIVFELANNEVKGEYLPKNTVLYNNENIPYLTQQDIYISNVKLKEVYCAYQYVVYDAFNKEDNSLTLFDYSVVLKPQKLYIGHKTIFDNLDSDSKIILSFNEDKSFLADSNRYKWTYSGKSYAEFKTVTWEKGTLVLTLDKRFPFKAVEIDGISSFFICCSPIKIESDLEFKINKIFISHMQITAPVEYLFHADIEILDKDTSFEPFGRTLISRDTFYIGCKKAFSNKAAEVTIKFETNFSYPDKIKSKPELSFSLDYWNGNGFVTLPILNEKRITDLLNGSSPVTIKFICPDDIETLLLNGIENIWLRIRLTDVKRYPVSDNNNIDLEDVSLSFSNLAISYVYDKNKITEPEQIIIEDNNNFHHINSLNNTSIFSCYNESMPTVYLGFDNNFEQSSISLFFELTQEDIIYYDKQYNFLFYEYTENKWKKINCIDETNVLQKTGIITLRVDSEFAKTTFLGKEQYWIKMVSPETDICKTIVKKIYMNAVKIIQKTLPVEESYYFVGESKYNLKQQNVLDVKVDIDGIPFTDFQVIEGVLILNNEKLLGDFKDNALITIRYSVSEGKKGNCEENTIVSSPISIGSVEKMYNPLPLEDGLSFETLEEKILRGTSKLRHRGYAVTPLDFEMLVLESSYAIKCKCYGNLTIDTDKFEQNQYGYITIVYLPMKYKNKGSISIKNKIKEYILERALPIFSIDDRLLLQEVIYIDIDLSFKIKIDEKESFVICREKLVKMLNDFFDPITGNFNNKGYDIGWIPDADFILHYLCTVDFIKDISNYLFVIREFENKKWCALPRINQIAISEIR